MIRGRAWGEAEPGVRQSLGSAVTSSMEGPGAGLVARREAGWELPT